MTLDRSASTGRAWHSLTTDEAQRAVARDPVVVLPLAAIEQHGPHLPLSTDLEIGTGLLADAFGRLPEDFPVWALPPLPIGASSEHGNHAGTLTMEPDLLSRVVVQIGSDLARMGVRRLVVSNSHGGNRAVVDTAALRLRREHGLLVVKAHYYRFSPPADHGLPDAEWRHGLHGGAVETAMMLHLHPESVRTSLITDFPSLGLELEQTMRRLGPEGEASFAWLVEDLGARGAVGDARLATEALGRRLVEHYGTALAEVIMDAKDFPLDRLRDSEVR